MAYDIHKSAFDDCTLTKLTIYQSYLEKWLPVFINTAPNKPWAKDINIFDFFCGPGQDEDGSEGSPLIAIKLALKYRDSLKKNGKVINLYFSDEKKWKVDKLNSIVNELELPTEIKHTTRKAGFKEAFMQSRKLMHKSANLLFLDQNGIKHVTPTVFDQLITLERTDFLFFISSSYLKRFGESDEFKQHIDISKLKKYIADLPKYTDIHRAVTEFYREMLPENKEYYLAPFSLKKNKNIYGLIFGSGHLSGILRFMQTVWNIDKETGDSNYDIDDDNLVSTTKQYDLFNPDNKSRKVQQFQVELEEMILDGKLGSDLDVYKYSLNSGFLPTKHAKEVLVRMIKDNKIEMQNDDRVGFTDILNRKSRHFRLV
jgi:three-Cys-motif partner protein